MVWNLPGGRKKKGKKLYACLLEIYILRNQYTSNRADGTFIDKKDEAITQKYSKREQESHNPKKKFLSHKPIETTYTATIMESLFK